MSPEVPEPLRVALRVIEVLEDLGVEYHVGGSYASSIHGVPRQTQDIDLVAAVPGDSVQSLVRRLSDDFYVDAGSIRQAIQDRHSFNAIHLDSGFKVDIFVRGDQPFDLEEFTRHRPVRVQSEPPRDIVVKSPEDTILRKLLWYREGGEVSDRQWNDVAGIVRNLGEGLDRGYLLHWAEVLGLSDLLARALDS